MSVNERTSLLHDQKNGNGVLERKGKLIIPMPKDPIFEIEDYWCALSLEEVLHYQDDPWWQKLRRITLYSFWFMLLLTFITACIIAYFHSNSSCKIPSIIITANSDLLTSTIVSTTMMSEVMSRFALAS